MDIFVEYRGYLIAAIVLGIFIAMGLLGGVFYIIRLRQFEKERQNRLWQIPSASLIRIADRVSAVADSAERTSL